MTRPPGVPVVATPRCQWAAYCAAGRASGALPALLAALAMLLSHATAAAASETGMHEVPVCVVGNGPSGLAASALLSGHWPFYTQPHPHRPLHDAIESERARVAAASGKSPWDLSLLELDLTAALRVAGSMEGGRSNNPWALLVDALLHPDADGRRGAADYTCLEFRHLPERSIEHVVIGRGPAGGSWNRMAPGTVTLSPGYWMALPGLMMTESTGLNAHALLHRIERGVVADYYQAYARKFLQTTAPASDPLERGATVKRDGGGLLIDAEVTAVEAAGVVGGLNPNSSDACAREESKHSWRVSYRPAQEPGPPTGSSGEKPLPLSLLRAQVVVLASGMADRPKQLEDCELPQQQKDRGADAVQILHRAPHSWTWSDTKRRGRVLVVGAGLSAADCVVAALRSGQWDVVHVFRGSARTTKVVSKFGQKSNSMYPEYYELAQLMQRHTQLRPHYEAHSHTRLRRVDTDGNCDLEVEEEAAVQQGTSRRVKAMDRVIILIGSTPDLSFLQGGASSPKAGEMVPVSSPSTAEEVSGRRATHPVYVDVHPLTLQVSGSSGAGSDREAAPSASAGLYAWGPLRGDNFVRFLVGDSWPLVQQLSNLPQH
jgi:threonine dehydrogenase-like Zn-dependent dehydrogenase